MVKSSNASSHTFTIDVLINMEGNISSKLYVCLKESDGKFGPRVLQNIIIPENIVLDCSSSGKVTKTNLQFFYEHLVNNTITGRSIIVEDSFTTHKTDFTNIVAHPIIKKTIKPGTTRFCQPLDLYFFRQFKIIIRRIDNHSRLCEPNVKIHSRDFILKKLSIAHNQLKSPKLRPMIRYAWAAGGYTTKYTFNNVLDTVFKDIHRKTCIKCTHFAFGTCCYCNEPLCFKHFILENHLHL